VNGALREAGDLAPANEGEALTSLMRAPTLEAARRDALARGLPVELHVPLPGKPEEGHVVGTLAPLTRPSGMPFWVLFFGPEGGDDERSTPIVELIERVDRVFERTYAEHPDARRLLAEMRASFDALSMAAGKPELGGIEPTPLGELMERAIGEVHALFPDRPSVAYASTDPSATIKIAESGGIALRALRVFLRIAARGAVQRAPEIIVEVQAAQVRLDLRGAAVADLGDEGRLLEALAEAIGGSIGRKAAGERAVLRLSLPRA